MKDETKAKRVLIVDDHPIVRHGLSQLIGQEKDLAVCGEASTCREALEAFERARPDVVMVDISLPDSSGLSLIKQLRDLDTEIPILVLSM
ncbi:MAG: response regulator transcription factor, partial [Candidatus Eisenbacteria bacterium]